MGALILGAKYWVGQKVSLGFLQHLIEELKLFGQPNIIILIIVIFYIIIGIKRIIPIQLCHNAKIQSITNI